MGPFWVKTSDSLQLAIIPRPRGGDWLEDDLRQFRQAGIDIVVSMLPPGEAAELGLEKEEEACREAGLGFRSFPVTDRETPSSHREFERFLESLRSDLQAGRSIGVHCRASIGRSSLMLAALLTMEGYGAADAFQRLSEARGLQVPDTPEQVRWVERFAER